MFANSQQQRSQAVFWGPFYRRRWWIYPSIFLCWAAVFILAPDNKSASHSQGRAQSSQRHSAPVPFLYSLGGLCLGVAVGAGLALFAERHDARFLAKENADLLHSYPALGNIPHLGGGSESQTPLSTQGWIELLAVAFVLLSILAGNIYLLSGW